MWLLHCLNFLWKQLLLLPERKFVVMEIFNVLSFLMLCFWELLPWIPDLVLKMKMTGPCGSSMSMFGWRIWDWALMSMMRAIQEVCTTSDIYFVVTRSWWFELRSSSLSLNWDRECPRGSQSCIGINESRSSLGLKFEMYLPCTCIICILTRQSWTKWACTIP